MYYQITYFRTNYLKIISNNLKPNYPLKETDEFIHHQL